MAMELKARRFTVADDYDAINFCFRQGWTDGLPVVPPTAERIEAMLAAAGLLPGDVIGVVSSRSVTITAEQVAINAVMAGCHPDYMPVVVAAIEGIADPGFQYHGPGASTAGPAILAIVNGPKARELDINSGTNLFGPGWRSNLTIGRAVRLVARNVLGSIPGALDMATFGHPGKLSYVIAEAEETSPWTPFHVDRGYSVDQSTVTVLAAAGPRQIFNQLSDTPEGVLTTLADDMRISATVVAQSYFVVLLGGEHMEIVERAGWSKTDVQRYLFENTKSSHAHLKRTQRMPMPIQPGDETRMLPVAMTQQDIWVLPAGGSEGSFSSYIPGWLEDHWSYGVTKEIRNARDL